MKRKKESTKKRKRQKSSVTNEVFPSYLFREGEKWTHVDKFGNIWYEDIKTTYSEQMQDELEPIFKK